MSAHDHARRAAVWAALAAAFAVLAVVAAAAAVALDSGAAA